jgi:hypothetical protein
MYKKFGGVDKNGGVNISDSLKIFNDQAQDGVKYKYNPAMISRSSQRNKINDHILFADQFKDIDSLLRNGQMVPLSINGRFSREGHLVVLTDVRGSGNNKQYLLSDSASGRTAWVLRKDMGPVVKRGDKVPSTMPRFYTSNEFPGGYMASTVQITGYFKEVPAPKKP